MEALLLLDHRTIFLCCWAKFKDFGCPCDSRHQQNWNYLDTTSSNLTCFLSFAVVKGRVKFSLLECVCVCGDGCWLVFMARHSDDGTEFSCSFHTADMSDVGSGIFGDKSTSYVVAVWIFQLWVTRTKNNPELLLLCSSLRQFQYETLLWRKKVSNEQYNFILQMGVAESELMFFTLHNNTTTVWFLQTVWVSFCI